VSLLDAQAPPLDPVVRSEVRYQVWGFCARCGVGGIVDPALDVFM
jgi:hypothetical protein